MNGSNDAMPADALRSIAMPDHIATPLGGLTFFDGLPDAATVSSSYDLLDLIRGIDVYLNTIPGASLVALRAGLRSVGVKDARTLAFTDPRSQFRELLPHAEHRDARTGRRSWICARTGRPSSRIRPESLCVVDDFWFRYVADLGMAGPDEGAGGKNTSSCRQAGRARCPRATSSSVRPPSPTGSSCGLWAVYPR